jgi:nicotinamidase-related amidase
VRFNQSGRTERVVFVCSLILVSATHGSLATGQERANRQDGESKASPATFRMPIRYYQIARLYGPGMPSSGREGLHTKLFEKSPDSIGLVIVHSWNLGEPDGPYPVKPGTSIPGEAGDWVPKAHGIIAQKIKPVLDAARHADIAVFHLAHASYASRYPQFKEIEADPKLRPPEKGTRFEVCAEPRSVNEMWEAEYGADFPGPVWKTHTDTFDIAKAIRPLPEEAVFIDGWQLNGLCRRRKIDTLIYVGFMADLCLVNIQGASREMTHKFKYRCVVLRDCTVAYEFAETVEGNWMTFAAVRLIESSMGYSGASDDFIAACQDVSGRKREK